jgi:hypothetical protein
MLKIYKYIFCKAYYICVHVFKEKEFPYFFASTMVSLAIVTTIITLLEVIEFLMLPTRVNTFGEYHGYFSLLMMVIIGVYFYRKKRYEKLLLEHESFSIKMKNKLKILSLIYLLILFFSFFEMGSLLREYKISHLD